MAVVVKALFSTVVLIVVAIWDVLTVESRLRLVVMAGCQ